LAGGTTFSIVHEKATWWCGFRPMEGVSRNVWVAVMVPEADIIGNVQQRQSGLWAAGGLVLLLIGGLALAMVRRYGRVASLPGDRLDSSDPEASICRLIGKGEGRTIEFKASMRMNLHTQKPCHEPLSLFSRYVLLKQVYFFSLELSSGKSQ
jgi:hypothetical protein